MDGPRSDRELIAAFLAGDRAAFAALVDRHQAAVLGFLWRRTRDPERARDLFQEVFLQAFRSIASVREGERLRGWLLRVAMHRVARVRSREKQRPSSIEWDAIESELPAAEDASTDVERSEMSEAVRREVARLPARQKQVVELRLYEELSFGEIGEMLEISEEAARANHYQAMRRLRERLRDHVEPGS